MKTALLTIAAVAAALTLAVSVGYQWAERDALRGVIAAQARADTLAVRLAHARDSVRVDSVRVDSIVTRWRDARARIDTLTDTLRLVDTLWRLAEQADRTITACTDALGRCQRAGTLADSLRAAEREAHNATRGQLGITQASLARAESRTWRYRAEGAAVCAASVFTIHRLTR